MKRGIKISGLGHGDIHSRKTHGNLRNLLPPIERSVLGMELNPVRAFNDAIEKAHIEIAKQDKENPQAKLLMTIPGIEYYSAVILLAEIGDIRRFPSPKKLCAYADLVPTVSQSGAGTIYAHITKQGNRWIRFVMVEAVQRTRTIQPDSPLAAMYRRIQARKGGGVAKVACVEASQYNMVHAYEERALPLYGSGDVRWERGASTEDCIQSTEKAFGGGQCALQ